MESEIPFKKLKITEEKDNSDSEEEKKEEKKDDKKLYTFDKLANDIAKLGLKPKVEQLPEKKLLNIIPKLSIFDPSLQIIGENNYQIIIKNGVNYCVMWKYYCNTCSSVCCKCIVSLENK